MKLVVDIPEEAYNNMVVKNEYTQFDVVAVHNALNNGTSLTPGVLADALMEERIRGKLNTDTNFEKDIIQDVKCRLTVSIIDHRPCYCGAGLREVWREREDKE